MTLGNVAKLYSSFAKYPMGKYLFSQLFCLKAPYFMSISPIVNDMKAGYGESDREPAYR
jgi:hypothetical protein